MSVDDDDWADFQSAPVVAPVKVEPLHQAPIGSLAPINGNHSQDNNFTSAGPSRDGAASPIHSHASRVESAIASSPDLLVSSGPSSVHSSPSLLDAAPIVAAGIRAASSDVLSVLPATPAPKISSSSTDDDDFGDFSGANFTPSKSSEAPHTAESTSSSSSLSLPSATLPVVLVPSTASPAPPNELVNKPVHNASEEFDDFTAQFISSAPQSTSVSSPGPQHQRSSSSSSSFATFASSVIAEKPHSAQAIMSDSTASLLGKPDASGHPLPTSADLTGSFFSPLPVTSVPVLQKTPSETITKQPQDEFGAFETPTVPKQEPSSSASPPPAPLSSATTPLSTAPLSASPTPVGDDDFGEFVAVPAKASAEKPSVAAPEPAISPTSPPASTISVAETAAAVPTLPEAAPPLVASSASVVPSTVLKDDNNEDFGDFAVPVTPSKPSSDAALSSAPTETPASSSLPVPSSASGASQSTPAPASTDAAEEDDFGDFAAPPPAQKPAADTPTEGTAVTSAVVEPVPAVPAEADDDFGDFEAPPPPKAVIKPPAAPTEPTEASPAVPAPAAADDDDFGDFEAAAPVATAAPTAPVPPLAAPAASAPAPPPPADVPVNPEAVRQTAQAAFSRAFAPLYSAAVGTHSLRTLKEVLTDHSARSRNFWGVLKCMECEASAPAHGQICVFCGSALAMTSPSEAKFEGSVIQRRFTEALRLPPPKAKKPKLSAVVSSGSSSAVSEKRSSSSGSAIAPSRPTNSLTTSTTPPTPQLAKPSPSIARVPPTTITATPSPTAATATSAPVPKSLQPLKPVAGAMTAAAATPAPAPAPKGKPTAAPTAAPSTVQPTPVLTPAILTPTLPKGATPLISSSTTKAPIDDDPWGGLLSKAPPVASASKPSGGSSAAAKAPSLDDFLSLTPVVTTVTLTPSTNLMKPTKAQQIADELLAALPDLSFMLAPATNDISSSSTSAEATTSMKKATAVVDLVNFSF